MKYPNIPNLIKSHEKEIYRVEKLNENQGDNIRNLRETKLKGKKLRAPLKTKKWYFFPFFGGPVTFPPSTFQQI